MNNQEFFTVVLALVLGFLLFYTVRNSHQSQWFANDVGFTMPEFEYKWVNGAMVFVPKNPPPAAPVNNPPPPAAANKQPNEERPLRSLEPGSNCSDDLQCRLGCCAYGRCQPKCSCPNTYWNDQNGCPSSWTAPDPNKPYAYIEVPNVPGLPAPGPIAANTVPDNTSRQNLPGQSCSNDLACKFGCCSGGVCQPKCQCYANKYWDGANGCPK